MQNPFVGQVQAAQNAYVAAVTRMVPGLVIGAMLLFCLQTPPVQPIPIRLMLLALLFWCALGIVRGFLWILQGSGAFLKALRLWGSGAVDVRDPALTFPSSGPELFGVFTGLGAFTWLVSLVASHLDSPSAILVTAQVILYFSIASGVIFSGFLACLRLTRSTARFLSH